MDAEMRLFWRGFAALAIAAAWLFAQSPASADPKALVAEGRKLNSQGKQDEALALYRQALQAAPDLFEAHLGVGVALDLKAEYGEARRHLVRAIGLAHSETKVQALRAMAMSHAFERDCAGAARYESQAYDLYLAAKDFYNAGEAANELARVCLEAGDLDTAFTWYQTGHNTGLREPDLKPDRRDLWDFRWEHAQARIAARRGRRAEAQAHVAAAKAILDKGANPNQAPFFPYLAGYVAFYAGDYKTAINELRQADPRDPFILTLLAQAHEKSGDGAQAMEYYRKALVSNAHNPPNAFARPLAKEKLK